MSNYRVYPNKEEQELVRQSRIVQWLFICAWKQIYPMNFYLCLEMQPRMNEKVHEKYEIHETHLLFWEPGHAVLSSTLFHLCFYTYIHRAYILNLSYYLHTWSAEEDDWSCSRNCIIEMSFISSQRSHVGQTWRCIWKPKKHAACIASKLWIPCGFDFLT